MSAALAVLLLLGQDKAVVLIQGLRSDSVEERETAERELKALGAAAVPALEKAAKDPDAEVAARARLLLRHVEVRAKLTPNLAKRAGLEDRLARGGPREWLAVLVELATTDETVYERRKGLTGADYRVLIRESLRLPLDDDAKDQVLDASWQLHAKDALPEVAGLLRDGSPRIRSSALTAIQFLEGRAHADEVAALLRDPDLGVRATAIAAVSNLVERSAPLLAPLLRDPEEGVRIKAAEGLRQTSAWEAIPDLTAALSDRSEGVRVELIRALGELEAREAVPALLKAGREGKGEDRLKAVEALGRLEAAAAVPWISSLLRDPSEEVVVAALGALEKMDRREAIPAIRRLLKDGRANVRWKAARALGELGAFEAASEIVALFGDESPAVRRGAMGAAGELGLAGARPRLAALLEDPDPENREHAASLAATLGVRDHLGLMLRNLGRGDDIKDSLVRLRAREALPELRKMAEGDGEAWEGALDVMVRLGDPEVLPLALKMAGDAERGERALVILTDIGAKEAIPVFRKALEAESDPNGRRCGVEGLLRAGDPGARAEVLRLVREVGVLDLAERWEVREAVPVLVEKLSDPRIEERGRLLEALDVLDPEGSPARARRVVDAPDLRRWEAEILGRRGGPEDAERLRVLLRDPEADVRAAAAAALLQVDRGRSMDLVIGVLDDLESGVRREIAQALGNVGAREAVPALRRLLGDVYPFIRRTACQALGAMELREAAVDIRSLLRDRNADVQVAALEALERLGCREAAGDVRLLLREGRQETAQAAAEWLGAMEVREAAGDLMRALREGRSVGIEAGRALARLKARECIPELLEMLRDPHPYVRRHALHALGALRDPALLEYVSPFLADANDGLRAWAVEAAARLGGAAAIPAVAALLDDPSPRVRQSVLWSLHGIGSPEAAPHFLKAMRMPGMGSMAAAALGELGARQAIPELTALVESGNDDERRAAIDALDRLRARESIPAIRRRLEDPVDWVRQRAAEALCSLGVRGAARALRVQGGDFAVLNALRSPEAWEKLMTKRFQGSPGGTTEDALGQVAGAAGFRVEWPADRPEIGLLQRLEWRSGSPEYFWNAAEFLSNGLGDFGWLLEEDRVRVLHKREGERFWNDWLRKGE